MGVRDVVDGLTSTSTTPAENQVIEYLGEHGACSQKTLEVSLPLSEPAIEEAVTSLESKGLISYTHQQYRLNNP